jgi:DNA repair exonuclease SbcCD ATPase subunit
MGATQEEILKMSPDQADNRVLPLRYKIGAGIAGAFLLGLGYLGFNQLNNGIEDINTSLQTNKGQISYNSRRNSLQTWQIRELHKRSRETNDELDANSQNLDEVEDKIREIYPNVYINRANTANNNMQIRDLRNKHHTLEKRINNLKQTIESIQETQQSRKPYLEQYLEQNKDKKFVEETIFINENTPNMQLRYNVQTNQVTINNTTIDFNDFLEQGIENYLKGEEKNTLGEKNTEGVLVLIGLAYTNGHINKPEAINYIKQIGSIYEKNNGDDGDYAFTQLSHELLNLME